MPPHEEYYTVFDGGDSMFLNIFFDFFPREGAAKTTMAVRDYFVMLGYEHLDPEKAAEKLTFEDVPQVNETFVIRSLPAAKDKCGELYRLWRSGGAHTQLRLNARITELLADIADYVNAPRQNAGSVTARMIVNYIDAHFNERLSCRSVAEKFSYHPNYVNRIVRELTGWSLHEYIIHVKIRHASQLLMETDMSITDIAYYLGFHDSSHFSSVYQMRTGMKPSELRKNQNGDPCKKERDLIT
jgi:AraC-like DNA-binding protein